MPRQFPPAAPKVVRNAEWDFVSLQSKKGAICPFCTKWHAPEGGPMDDGSPCVAVYVRSRKTAIVVSGIPNSRAQRVAGVRIAPSDRDVRRCLAVADAYRRGEENLPGGIHRDDLGPDPLQAS